MTEGDGSCRDGGGVINDDGGWRQRRQGRAMVAVTMDGNSDSGCAYRWRGVVGCSCRRQTAMVMATEGDSDT